MKALPPQDRTASPVPKLHRLMASSNPYNYVQGRAQNRMYLFVTDWLKLLSSKDFSLHVTPPAWILTLIRANGYDSITEFIDSLGHNLTYLLSICT
ncbi:hypothetical protein [Moorena producens]|uniref:hypothetical protein n=1 Tax=Moorena producens TaxID=1155739 RepID=UPI003C72454F